jgi:hypothetical protein
MQYQVDNDGTWTSVGSFVAATATGGTWTGLGPAEPLGTYTLYVRNTYVTSVYSNTETYVISQQGITLDSITATANVAAPIGGLDLEVTTAAAMQYQVDGTSLWSTVDSFSAASTSGGSWSGLGPAEPPGTYTLQVRNTANASIVSNVETYIIPLTSVACVLPPDSPSLGRWRGACGINWFNTVLIGDAFCGVVGQMDFNNFTEYGIYQQALVTTPPIHSDRKRIFIRRFEIDVESGVGLPSCCGSNPLWILDFSKDGGRTWSEYQVVRSMGRIGAYRERLRWLRLGQSRQWIFRLRSTDPVRRVIIGTYADITEGMA